MAESARLQDWLSAIEAAHPADIELGLGRVAAVAERMGLLPAPIPVVLVGGTNGKGSTLAFLESALVAGGHAVGGYTSPHLFRFNERIRVGGEAVADEALIAAFEAVEGARRDTALTYFEFTTLAAMAVFTERAEVALLEVGLGGRLDAVNIWEPSVSVITSVDLDHQAFLGDDREAIGAEKAGILRPGVPAVCGDARPPRSVTAAAGEDLWLIDRDFRAEAGQADWRWVGPDGALEALPRPGLAGAYQVRNAATAIAAGERLPASWRPGPEAWRRALADTRIPGRGQVVAGDVPVWLDVGHNPQAAEALATLLREQPVAGRTLAVFGAMRDKAVAEVGAAMAGVVDRWYPCGMPGERALGGSEVAAELPAAQTAIADPAADPAAALAQARAEASPGQDRVVAFGSFLVVAAVLEAMGESPD